MAKKQKKPDTGMVIDKFEDEWSWREARRGSITGSRLGSVITQRGMGYKTGVYEVIAEKLGLSADDEDPMDRGHRLEPEALARFTEETGIVLNTDRVIWRRKEDHDIALSPDGYTEDFIEAAEAKCISSAKHLQAYFEQKVPNDYEFQKLQYFIVNRILERLHFCFYDPRLAGSKDFFIITIKREDVQEDVDHYLAEEERILGYIRSKVIELSF